jgi:hypothetical protein
LCAFICQEGDFFGYTPSTMPRGLTEWQNGRQQRLPRCAAEIIQMRLNNPAMDALFPEHSFRFKGIVG